MRSGARVGPHNLEARDMLDVVFLGLGIAILALSLGLARLLARV